MEGPSRLPEAFQLSGTNRSSRETLADTGLVILIRLLIHFFISLCLKLLSLLGHIVYALSADPHPPRGGQSEDANVQNL